jgi:hypothetical protein
MENPGIPTISNLIEDWLHQEFPNNVIYIEPAIAWTTTNDGLVVKSEVMVDGVGVAELVGIPEKDGLITISLLSPNKGIAYLVSIAHPESLPFLSECVQNHLDSKDWSSIMKANREKTSLLITHRSSLGYKKIWTH